MEKLQKNVNQQNAPLEWVPGADDIVEKMSDGRVKTFKSNIFKKKDYNHVRIEYPNGSVFIGKTDKSGFLKKEGGEAN